MDVALILEALPKNYNEIPPAKFGMDGFELFANFTGSGDHGRGILAYVSRDLECEAEVLPFSENLLLRVGNRQRKLTLLVVYRSPNSGSDNDTVLSRSVRELFLREPDAVLLGDLNFPGLDWNSYCVKDRRSAMFSSVCRALRLSQMVTFKTRARGLNAPSLLDVVLVKNQNLVSGIRQLAPFGNSDHSSLLVDFPFSRPLSCSREVLLWNKADYAEICAVLDSLDLTGVLDAGIDSFWNEFKRVVFSSVMPLVPSFRSSAFSVCKWFDSRCCAVRKHKLALWKKFLFCPNRVSWTSFKQARNYASSVYRSKRITYESNLCSNIGKNPKQFWSYVRSPSSGHVVRSLRRNDEYVYDSSVMAECFQEFFHSVFNPVMNVSPSLRCESLLNEFSPITPLELESVLKALPKGKAAGPDLLKNELFLGCSSAFSKILCPFFNLCLRRSAFPLEWKSVIVSPIFKSGEKTDVLNYRPITLSSVVLKVFERCVYRRLLSFLDSVHAIPDCQFGFRSNRSVQDELMLTVDFVSKGLNARKNVVGVYFDFQKAFDKIPTAMLVEKLRSVGLCGPALELLKFYLSDREQVVKVGSSFSSSRKISSGVPQGSVLGPLLFLIFVREIPSLISSETLVLQFADDLKLLRVVSSELDVEMLERDIRSVLRWSEVHCMPLNRNKCKIVEFGKSDVHAMKIASLSDFSFFHVVDAERDLGVIFDSKLNFDSHVKSITNKANFALHRVSTTFRRLDCKRFLILYKSFVRPLLEFCSPVWNPSNKNLSNLIEKIQKRATKLVPSLRHLSYTDRLRSLKLDSLEFRRKREDLILLYKINNSRLRDSVLSFRTRPGMRGHDFVLSKERTYITSRRHFLTNRSRSSWNALSLDAVHSPTLNVFKSSIRCLPGSWRSPLPGGSVGPVGGGAASPPTALSVPSNTGPVPSRRSLPLRY